MTDPKQPESPKPVDTTAVVLAIVGLLKDIGMAVAMAFVEFARAKQRQAEDKAAIATTELSVLKKTIELEKANEQKSPSDVIDDFLHPGGDAGEK